MARPILDPWQRVVGERVEKDHHGQELAVLTLECGHEVLRDGEFLNRRGRPCVACTDEAQLRERSDPPAQPGGGEQP